MQRRGGKLLAVSVDTPAEARAVVDKARLPFSILSDTSREMIRGYGLVHTGGGRDGSDIAKPATVLIGGDGRVRWLHVGRTVVDRPDTAALLAALADLTK